MSERRADAAGDAGMVPSHVTLSSLRPVVAAGALATGLMALWLCFVVVAVLPSRDPQHTGLWSGIAAAFFAYAAASLVFAVRGPRPPWLRSAVVLGSLAALGFGGWEILAMARAARTGGHFEGYLLLMGAMLAAQGLCAFAYAALTVVIARRVRAS